MVVSRSLYVLEQRVSRSGGSKVDSMPLVRSHTHSRKGVFQSLPPRVTNSNKAEKEKPKSSPGAVTASHLHKHTR